MRRRFLVLTGLITAIVAVPAAAGAHGIGGRSDLPIPVEFFIVGGGVVLALSFAALAVLWPEPRLQDGPRLRGRGFVVPGWLTAGAGTVGVAWLALVIGAGLFGTPDARTNIAPVSLWVLFWLVLPFLAAAIGNAYRLYSPWSTLGRWLGLDFDEAPPSWGILPASAAFFAFTWLELVPGGSGDPKVIGMAAVVYTGYLMAWTARVGVGGVTRSIDAFAVYHRLLAAIAPFARDDDGRIRRSGWLRGLPVLAEVPGLVVFVVLMIATVSYDGLSATPWWDDLSVSIAGDQAGSGWFQTLGLLAIVGVIGGGYLAASWFAARAAHDPDITAAVVARRFAHTLVPIALAYAFAHYFTLVLFEGQIFFAALSDPFGVGWNLFGTAAWRPNYTWVSPTVVWYVQLVGIVGGHLAGVVLAHDRALAMFRSRQAVSSQYAMLALMVALTGLGLTILAAG